MANYRQSRNIEGTFIDYLQTNFDNDWSNVRVEKTFALVRDGDLPAICVRVRNTSHPKAELGSDSTIRETQILIDIFATSDGQKLDLTDYIVEKIKTGCIYYEYTAKGASRSANGRIRVKDIDVTPLEFDTDEPYDRYRSLITLSVGLGRIEA